MDCVGRKGRMWFSPAKDQPQPTKELMKLIMEEHIPYKNVETVGQKTTEGDNPSECASEAIKEYVKHNVPIVPLKENGLPNVNDLFTTEELKEIESKLSDFDIQHVFEDPENRKGIKLVNLLIRQNPLEFWTDERICRQKWYGIASLAGPSTIPSESDQNKVKLFIEVDADEPRAIAIVRRVIEKRGYLSDKKTIVQNSPGENRGIHCVFSVPVDPNNLQDLESWRRRFLRQNHCKPGGKVEIKTWFSGQITLAPSRYRKDRSKFYKNISGYKGVFEDDPILYDLLISELRNGNCLRITPEEAYKLEEEEAEKDTKYSNGAASVSEEDRRYNDPSNIRVETGIDILLGRDVDEKGECQFTSVYVPGFRNPTILSLGAHLFHNRIRLEFAKEIVRRLCEASDYKDVKKPLDTVEDTYRKGYRDQKLRGKSGLIDLFKIVDRNGENEVRANARLAKLNEAFGFNINNNSKCTKNSKFERLNEADLIADLARKKINFMFINHIGQPFAVVKIDDVVEVMDMGDKDGDFMEVLRRMWRDKNEANGNKLKTTIAENKLNEARLALVSDVKRFRVEPIKTHTRIAWRKKNKIIRYDLADAFGRQVEISGSDDGSSVKLIGSAGILEDIKEFQESGFSKDKVPIFFQKYNQTAQVIPSNNFPSDIFDIFINDLTNVTGKKASSSYKRSIHHWGTEGSLSEKEKTHIAKVVLISLLIPEISHYIINIFGPPSSVKTTFEKQTKSLIDPTGTPVFTPLKIKDIDIILSENHCICFDNYTVIDKAFSDLICSTTTGAGTRRRILYTTKKMIDLPIKVCYIFSSVTRLFTEPDALSRLINFEFMPFNTDQSYFTDDEMNSKFEGIKPQLMAYIFHIISKAINIRPRMVGRYNLGRMADVLEWSEAISQAMGYEPGSFLDLHKKLDKIQRKHSASYDPLIHYYKKLLYDLFEKPVTEPGTTLDENIRESARKDGYVILDYGQLHEKLLKYAEVDEYDTKKSNKLWPHDSKQLADRTREVSIIISRYDIMVEVRRGKNYSNEYIIGTKEAVEKFIESQENDPSHVDSNMGVQSSVQLNASGKTPFLQLQKNIVSRSIEQRPQNFKIKKVDSGGVQLNSIEHIEHPLTRRIEQELTENGNEYSIFEHRIKQRRSKVLELNTAGHSQRDISKMLNISLGLVNLDLKYIRSQNLSVQSVQVEHQMEKLNTSVQKEYPRVQLPQQQDFKAMVPELENVAAFDCEWYRNNLKSNIESRRSDSIYCFCLTNNKGQNVRLHLDDNFHGDRVAFMTKILDIISSYDALIGYSILAQKKKNKPSSFDADIVHLKQNCELTPELKDRFEKILKRVKILDVHRIFSSSNVKNFLEAAEGIEYKEEKLNIVAKAYLDEGKLDDLNGSRAEFLDSPEKQMDYCLQDAKLSLKLIQKNDYRLCRILFVISKEINLDFDETCNTAIWPTSWWFNYLEQLGYKEVSAAVKKYQLENCEKVENNGWIKKGVEYVGGKVLSPITGIHENVETYDVSSMYPMMANVHNISSETINCICCENDPSARIPDEVMTLINDGLKEPRPYHYWICKQRRGIFAEVMRKLYEKKLEYKRLDMKLEEKAIKLLANSGYGTFGQPYFKYYDFRVAELITAFARHTLLGLKDFLQEKGLKVIYGDTDSLFVKKCTVENYDITSKAKCRFQVEFIKDKSWKVLVLLSKKEYFGILENGNYCRKTIYGLRDDKPPYFNTVTSEIISKKFLEQDSTQSSLKERALEYVQSAYSVLSDKIIIKDEIFIREQLPWRIKISKSLSQYASGWQKHVFEEKLAESGNNLVSIELDNPVGSIQPYWKTIPEGNGERNVTIHPECHALDLHQYKEDLWTCFEPILEAYGYTEDELIRLRNELFDNHLQV